MHGSKPWLLANDVAQNYNNQSSQTDNVSTNVCAMLSNSITLSL